MRVGRAGGTSAVGKPPLPDGSAWISGRARAEGDGGRKPSAGTAFHGNSPNPLSAPAKNERTENDGFPQRA
jgi:hypothetical protein